MPFRKDNLTKYVTAAWKLCERQVDGHWASGFILFERGFRAGYEQGKVDAYLEDIDNARALLSRRADDFPDQPSESKVGEQGRRSASSRTPVRSPTSEGER